MKPLIITCALLGAELTRAETPYLPLSPDEIVRSAQEVDAAGAAMVHLHVRDERGMPTCCPDIFAEVITRIRQTTKLIIQVSTGGAIGDSEADRLQPLMVMPDMASLSTGSVNFGEDVFLNPQPFIETLAAKMNGLGIKPEIEIFDVAMLETALRMVTSGQLHPPLHIDLVLGVPGAMEANERNLDFLLKIIPSECTWSVAAIGRHQFPMLELALRKGGHVRVGMEDNIYLEKGVLAQSNAELVAKVTALAKQYDRNIVSASEARLILNLPIRES